MNLRCYQKPRLLNHGPMIGVTTPVLYQLHRARVPWKASEREDDVKPFFESTPVTQEQGTAKPLVVDELIEELTQSKDKGKRGEIYFALQALLIFLVVFPPKGLGDIITTVGFIGLCGGIGIMASSGLSLGDNLSPLPKPRDDHSPNGCAGCSIRRLPPLPGDEVPLGTVRYRRGTVA